MRLRIAVDDADAVDLIAPTSRFDQQRHDKHKITSLRDGCPRFRNRAYHGVDNRFKLVPRFWAFENKVAHGMAIQRTGGRYYVGPEMLADGFDGGAARGRQFVRDDIGVDHRRTPSRKIVGDAALARAYATRQTNLVHAAAPLSAGQNTNVPQTRGRMLTAYHRRKKAMFSPALLLRHPSCRTAGAVVVAIVLAGCAQQRPSGYYDAPQESTLSDAQHQAQGRSGARAPSQIQLGFGGQEQVAETQRQQAAEGAGAIKARPLAEPKTFLGTLPCLTGGSACSATRITLTLAPGGEWRARTAFVDRPDASNNIVQQGCWNVIGTQPWRIVLQLQNEASKANLTFVNDNVLRVNFIDDIKPALDYHLTRQADIDPIDELKKPAALQCAS